MQRLARFYVEANNVEAIELFSRYDALSTLLQKHLPPSTATIFAKPCLIEEDNQSVVEWWTQLQGQPQYLTPKDSDYKATNALLEQRLRQIEMLYETLLAQQALSEQDAHNLARLVAVGQWKNHQIYRLNGEPVIVGWAMYEHRVVVSKPREIPAKPTQPRRRWLLLPLLGRRLLALLLLMGLASLWCYWGAPTCLNAPHASADSKVVLLFDTSGSMADFFKKGITKQMFVSVKAKDLIDKVAPNIAIGFVEFSSHADNYGTFGFWQRRQLKEKISGLPSSGGTNFPQGLQQAMSTFEPDTEGSIVIFSDGDGGNVCRYAKQVAEQTPNLKIFAVDLGRENEDKFCDDNTHISILAAKDEKAFDAIIDEITSPYQCKLFE